MIEFFMQKSPIINVWLGSKTASVTVFVALQNVKTCKNVFVLLASDLEAIKNPVKHLRLSFSR